MKDIRKRPHRATPGLVPEELLGMRGICPICRAEVEIPWLETCRYTHGDRRIATAKITFTFNDIERRL